MGCGCNKQYSYDESKVEILAQHFANETKINQIIYETANGFNFMPQNCVDALGKKVVKIIEPYRQVEVSKKRVSKSRSNASVEVLQNTGNEGFEPDVQQTNDESMAAE